MKFELLAVVKGPFVIRSTGKELLARGCVKLQWREDEAADAFYRWWTTGGCKAFREWCEEQKESV